MLCCTNCTQTAEAPQSSFRFPRLRNQLIAAIYIGDVSQQEIVSTHRDTALAFFTQTGPLVLTWLVLKGLYLLQWSSYILRLIWMWLMLMHLNWYWLPSHLNAWMCFISNITRRTNDAVTFNMGLCSLTLAFMQFKLLKSEIHLSLFDLFLFLHSLTHFHRCILHVQLNSIDCLMYEED